MSNKIRPLSPLHRPVAIICLALTILAVVPFSLLGVASAAPASAIDWDGRPIDISGSRSYHASVVFDSNSHYHAFYVGREGKLVYATDVSGSRNARTLADNAGGDINPLVNIAINGNTLHGAFEKSGSDNQVYYIRGHISGSSVSWDTPIQMSHASKTTSPSVGVGANGTAYVAWGDKNSSCAAYGLAIRSITDGGNLSSQRGSPIRDCGSIQARPAVVVTNDGAVHVIFSSDSSIYYARLVNGSWEGQVKLGSGTNPDISTDGTALYAVYGKGRVNFRRSLDGGNTWSNALTYGGSDSRADYGTVAWSATAQRAIVAWSDDEARGNIDYDLWTREFIVSSGQSTAADQLSHNDNVYLPSIAAGPRYVGVAYQTKRVYLWRGVLSGTGTTPTVTPTTTPTTCNGAVALAGGAAYTTSTSVAAVITPSSSCSPTKMQYSVDTPITTATSIVDYNETPNITLTDTGACTPHTLYVRLYNGTVGGDVFSSSIIVDQNVSASVKLENPFLPGHIASKGSPTNGDPNYTRTGEAYLGVTDVSDCSGIKNFSLTSGTPQTLTNGSYAGYITLPNGSQYAQVSVTDNAGNSKMYPADNASFNIITDRDAPTLTGTPVVAGPASTSNILVTLNFSNVLVNDATYTKNAAGKQFWGVYVANSHSANVTDPAALDWQTVQVPTPDTAFSFQWSLFSGLGATDRVTNQPYYVYVKFMDGAGNLTTQQIISAPITLNTGYTQPTLNLPLLTTK